MSFRRKLNDPKFGGAVIVGVVALSLLIAGFFFFGGEPEPGGRTAVTEKWYYDLGSKQLFLVHYEQAPPDNAARAFVYSCGDCHNESERFISFLQITRPEGVMVRTDDDDNWVLMESPQGKAVLDINKRHPCNGTPAHICLPGR